eukprot:CAMPEP_0184330124 /NCGR_PEP_ID=MMETSP1049-20130417/144516_1 /TAXON_ID=77928 /ORGANISM="Proteomonas sulcata, Strain CCMP704" /LENGTH=361 /DNA_ID=CAMNT_0026652537 /DNA_START=452 /DNA_END=1537 /DNA_ORIENTATION=-
MCHEGGERSSGEECGASRQPGKLVSKLKKRAHDSTINCDMADLSVSDISSVGNKRRRLEDADSESLAEREEQQGKRSRRCDRRVSFAPVSRVLVVPSRHSAAQDASASENDSDSGSGSDSDSPEQRVPGHGREPSSPPPKQAAANSESYFGSLEDFQGHETLHAIGSDVPGSELQVKTKEEDGPSAANVATQALVVGLIQRTVNGVDSVLTTLRASMKQMNEKTATKTEAEATKAEVAEADEQPPKESPASSADVQEESEQPRANTIDLLLNKDDAADQEEEQQPDKFFGELELFEMVHARMQVLIERIENHGRAALLPSTAQLGPPFVPALKFLQNAIRCAPHNSMIGHQCEAAAGTAQA